MMKSSYRGLLERLLLTLAILVTSRGILAAQEATNDGGPRLAEIEAHQPIETASLVDAPSSSLLLPAGLSSLAIMPVVSGSAPGRESVPHPFWDRENRILFTVAGGMAAADFFVTRANLASGGRELNPVTRIFSGSTPGLATNFALETGGVIGMSYLFHRTGHHRLERMVSLVNVGSSVGAVTYGLTHR